MPGDHDSLVQVVFSVPENAAAELKAVLPAELVQRLDWESLRRVPGSFIDKDRRGHHTDLLFSIRARGGANKGGATEGATSLRLYVLFEHQSTVDHTMPIRLLTYLARVYAALAKKDRGPLPVVLPLVLHHSRSGWTAAKGLGELLDMPEDLAPTLRRFVPDFQFLVDDLGRTPDVELLRREMPAAAKVTLWILAAIRRPHDPSLILEWLRLTDSLAPKPRGEVEETILGYLSEVTLAKPLLQALMEARANSDTETAIMGLRKEWEDAARERGLKAGLEEGRQKGREEGRQEGRQEGRLEARTEVLLKQLRLRFSDLPDAAVSRIETAEVADLDRWTERVLSAETLAEVFADDEGRR